LSLPGSSDNQRNRCLLYVTFYIEGGKHALFFRGEENGQVKYISDYRLLGQANVLKIPH
jgi:hypothetical protein